ncbi:hypothetical protein IKC_06142 [Bacillus cereus VD184]|uniref:Uncharacterized protein n=1 Tax=Bacillus cereus VD184 TaxID=1053242 RepID=A0A9W5R0N0_BACCE|nr:hypothetical protein IKC_06142 [Bacillus cereus VD184]
MEEFFMNKWVAGSIAMIVVLLGSYVFMWSGTNKRD